MFNYIDADCVSFPAVNQIQILGSGVLERVKARYLAELLAFAECKGLVREEILAFTTDDNLLNMTFTTDGRLLAVVRVKGGKSYSYLAKGAREEAKRRRYAGF